MASSLDTAQDAVWCDLCPSDLFLKSTGVLHCKPCNINLCQGCAGNHLLSKTSKKHDIVEYMLKEAGPKYPDCKTHQGKNCELQCKQCKVPVCAMCLFDSHQGHLVEGISALINSKKAQITQDNEELENLIAPEYEKQDSELLTKMSEKSQQYDAIITSIDDHGQDWHKEVDLIVNKHTTDVQNDKKEDLGYLQKQHSEIRNTKSVIYQTIQKNKKILKFNDVTELVNYRSRNTEFRQIPPRAEFPLPSFKPIKIQRNELLTQFGSISSSSVSNTEEHKIKISDHIFGALSLKEFLERSKVITKIDSDTLRLRRMSCVGSDEVWISGHERTIKRFNIYGKLIEKVTDVCEGLLSYPHGLSVTGNGAVLYCDYKDRSVKMFMDNNIHTVIKLQNWKPLAVCSSSSGDILVLIKKEGNVKLVRYSGIVMKQEMQEDHNGIPLFSSRSNSGYHWIRYMEENRNQDICVQNFNAIVVLNQSGQLRFRYNGKHSSRHYATFNPRGIATDSMCHILVADISHNCVHVLDKDGQFLCYIHTSATPIPVSVDSQDRLWVGYFEIFPSNKIQVIQYMK